MATSGNTQSSVPKFSSFRPREPIDEGKDVTNASVPKEQSSRKERHHAHRHHHRHRSSDRDRGRDRDESKEKVVARDQRRRDRVVNPSFQSSVPVDTPSSLFVIDKNGDNQNLIFGSIHSYNVPPFHRIGAGRVLGSKNFLKIDRIVSDDKGLVLNDYRHGNGSKREKYAFSRNEKKTERLLRILPDILPEGNSGGDSDFIPLRNLRPKKRQRSSSSSSASSNENQEHYRSIEGKAKVCKRPKDESMEFVTESDSSDPESGRSIRYDATIRQRSIELSRRVDLYPQDIDAWLDLISHQDSLLGLSDEGRRKITAAEIRSTADIKLHLYEKALKMAGTTMERRERLLIGLMSEGSKIWDFKTQSEKWEQVSQQNLQSIVLWKRYLDFRQSTFINFQYEEVRNIFSKRISLLKIALIQGNVHDSDDNNLYEHLIYTVLRATLFMREAGYTEIAVGVWQGLLELNCYKLPVAPLTGKDKISILEEFWDAEVPRIGEEGSVGILNFISNPDDNTPDSSADEEFPPHLLDGEDLFEGWATAEIFRSHASQLPARTMDTVTEDDPYRVILWSDIENFMIDLTPSSSGETLRHVLLGAFIIFCGLPPLPCTKYAALRGWRSDSFIRSELLNGRRSWISAEYLSLQNGVDQLLLEGHVAQDSIPIQPELHSFAISLDSLFPITMSPRYFTPWRTLYGELNGSGPVPYSFIRNSLKSLTSTWHDPDISEYYLAFELCNEPDSIKNMAKGLLKKNPNSLRLYNAYALIELSRDNKEVAISVTKAALNIPNTKDQDDHIFLWRTWAWLLLSGGDRIGCLKSLLCITDGLPASFDSMDISSPTNLMKTRQYLSSKRDFGSYTDATTITYVELLALLQYVSSESGSGSSGQGDISSTLAVFEDYSTTLEKHGQKHSMIQELLLQSACKVLAYHAHSG
jgi:hypothetical protein